MRVKSCSPRAASCEPPISKSVKTKKTGSKCEANAAPLENDFISPMKRQDAELNENYIVISDQWRQDWDWITPQKPAKPGSFLPSDVIVLPENENIIRHVRGFKMPSKLLHETTDEMYKQSVHELYYTHSLEEKTCKYNLDHFDESWLRLFNDVRVSCELEKLSPSTMEWILAEIQDICYAKVKTAEAEEIKYDENTVCDVCRQPEVEEGNEMVFCDACDIGVHQACYGVVNIPDGSWLCRTCEIGLSPRCALCTTTGGAMKSTKDGSRWAHVSCAIWIPDVTFLCSEKMEPIGNLDCISTFRRNLTCCVCRKRSGACIPCCGKKCTMAFHVTCAFKMGFYLKMSYKEPVGIQFDAFCGHHSGMKNTFESKPKKTSTIGITYDEKERAEKARIQKVKKEFYKFLTPTEVADILELDRDIVSSVFNYWKLKRNYNCNRFRFNCSTASYVIPSNSEKALNGSLSSEETKIKTSLKKPVVALSRISEPFSETKAMKRALSSDQTINSNSKSICHESFNTFETPKRRKLTSDNEDIDETKSTSNDSASSWGLATNAEHKLRITQSMGNDKSASYSPATVVFEDETRKTNENPELHIVNLSECESLSSISNSTTNLSAKKDASSPIPSAEPQNTTSLCPDICPLPLKQQTTEQSEGRKESPKMIFKGYLKITRVPISQSKNGVQVQSTDKNHR